MVSMQRGYKFKFYEYEWIYIYRSLGKHLIMGPKNKKTFQFVFTPCFRFTLIGRINKLCASWYQLNIPFNLIKVPIN